MRLDGAVVILQNHREELTAMGVQTLAVFGSVLHRDIGDEDEIDVLAEFSRPMGFDFFTVRRRLQDLLGRSVNLTTRDALESDQRDAVLREAVRAA